MESIDDSILAETLGGKGLATHLLMKCNPPGINPLSPENKLIFTTGPFCNNQIWGASRYGVFTKSPQTGFYAESYSGGRVPEAIDSTGFDAIILTGKAGGPIVLSITPQEVEFLDGSDLWGMSTGQAEQEAKDRFGRQKKQYKKVGAITIGPAGENLVCFAGIMNDGGGRCAGRTGVGAVMGSKNCKAILFQGDCRRELYQQDKVVEYYKDFSKEHKENPGVKAYKKLGTTMMVSLMNSVGAFPAKYWSQGNCKHWQQISGETLHEEHEVQPKACSKCFIACSRNTTIGKGVHAGLKLDGPEYETIYVFGGLCLVKDIAEVAYLNDLCDRAGLDTITTGNLCALTIEASRNGKIDYKLDYGDADGIADLIDKIVRREGIGDLLAEGIKAAAQEWGLEDQAVHVKGLEPAGYDPRVLKGMGLTYGTAPRGACHLRTTFYKPELAGIIDPETTSGKAKLLVDYEDRLNIFDSLILCRFYRDLYTWEELTELIYLVTGLSAEKEDLRAKAAVIATATRRFNLREGLQAVDDRLPKRLHKEILPPGKTLSSNEMELMLKEYYRCRGWNVDGIPEEQKK